MSKLENSDEIQIFYSQIAPNPSIKVPDRIITTLITNAFTDEIALDYLKKLDPNIIMPHFLDNLQRKDNLSELIQTLLNALNTKIGKDIGLHLRDIVVAMTHTQSPYIQKRIFWHLILARYPIPILYPCVKEGRIQSYCSTVAFNFLLSIIGLPIVLFVKPNNEQIKCTTLASKLFNFDPKRIYGEGALKRPTIDAYFSETKSKLDYRGVVVDANGWSEDKEFINTITNLASIASLVLVNITQKDIESESLEKLLSCLKIGSFGKIVVFIRGTNGKSEEKNNFEMQYNNIECIVIKDIKEENSPQYINAFEQFFTLFWTNIYKTQLDKLKDYKNDIEKSIRDLAEPSLKITLDEENNFINKIEPTVSISLANEIYPLRRAFGKFRKIMYKKFQMTFESLLRNKKFEADEMEKLLKKEDETGKTFHEKALTDSCLQMINFFNTKNLDEVLIFDNKLQIKQADFYQHILKTLNTQKAKYDDLSRKKKDIEKSIEDKFKGQSIIINDLMRKQQIERNKIVEEFKAAEKEYKKTLRVVSGLDIGFKALCEEIMLAKETKIRDSSKMKDLLKFQEVFVENFLKGMEIQLLKGAPLYIACEGFDVIIKDISDKLQHELGCTRLSVVSILGDQSSCKSTLMNYLCGSNFPSSEGKCTKGINCRLANFDNGHFVLFLDTEGLQSVDNENNQIFDNQLSVFAMIVSEIVIINLKGDISPKEESLLQVCLFAFKHLNPRPFIKPTIMFSLRDHPNASIGTQELHFSLIRKTLRDKLCFYHINLDELIDMHSENIFLMDCAINAVKSVKESPENESFLSINAAQIAEGFSKQTKEFRAKIKLILEKVDIKDTFRNLQDFYKTAESIFVTVIKYGIDICNFDIISKLEMRDKIRQTSTTLLNEANLREDWNNKVKLIEDSILISNDENVIISIKKKFEEDTCELLNSQINEVTEKLISSLKARKIVYDECIAEEEKNNVINFLNRRRNLMKDIIIEEANKKLSQLEFNKLEKALNEKVASIKNKDDKAELEEVKKEIEKEKNKFSQEKVKEIRKNDTDIAEAITIQFGSSLSTMSASQIDLKVINTINAFELFNKNPNFGEKDWIIPGRSHTNESEQIIYDTIRKIKIFIETQMPYIVNEFKDIHSIWDCMGPFIIKVNALSTQIIQKNQHETYTIFSAALQNGIFRLILPKVFERICKNEDEIEKNEMEERQRKIEKIYSQVQGYLKARNSKEFGEQIGTSIADTIEENVIEGFETKFKTYLLTFLQKTWSNPEAVIREAYRISFEDQNFPNVLKFILDIEMFIKEIVAKKIDEDLERFYIESNDQVKEDILEALRQMLAQLSNKKTQFKSIEDAYEILKKNPLTREICDRSGALKTVAISESESFFEGISKQIQEKNKKIKSTDKIIKNTQSKMQTTDKEEAINYYVGCNSKCKLCGAKCVKERNHYNKQDNEENKVQKPVEPDHVALHQLCVFGGWTYAWFQTPMVIACSVATNGIFFNDKNKGEQMLNYIEREDKNWHNDLRNSQMVGPIEILKRGWANSRLPFQKCYGMINHDTKDILDLIVSATQLPPTYPLPGYMQENALKKECKPPLVDAVFLLDCTGSMAPEIEKARDSIDKIMNLLKDICGSDIKIGFVGYRDHSLDPKKLETAKLTVFKELNSNMEEVKEFIVKEAIADGGEDFAEAVADGLYRVDHDINWRPNSRRFVFHIFDAPPHGREYINDSSQAEIDNFPDGCPCKHDIPKLLHQIDEKGVKYCLIAVSKIEKLQKMKDIFQQNYNGMFYVELVNANDLVNHITWLMSKRVGIPKSPDAGQNIK